MNICELIRKKKRGEALTEEEISFFVKGVTDGSLRDYQISAFLMAVCFQGMTPDETAILTREMMHSGQVLDLSSLGGATVDKHSTGGVGDKTTLILAPIVAACGATVAKMSGRGLGHTGGTVDKMESIPGMQTTVSADEFFRIAREKGICVVGQSGSLAPADKKLYALRDVTETIDSIPLIASSIMSKKLASGAKSIVLDVKCGSGAFMKTPENAMTLAEAMVEIGTKLGRNVCALVTDMDTPLGTHIGNALEVKEAILTLRGEGDEALTRLCTTLAARMLMLALSLSEEQARERVQEALDSGSALAKMEEWICAQGGDAACVSDLSRLPCAAYSHKVLSPFDGVLAAMDTEAVGLAAGDLGAGRKTKEDVIDPAAGIVLEKRRGERIAKGERLATLYASDPALFCAAEKRFLSALTVSCEEVEEIPLIYGIVMPNHTQE